MMRDFGGNISREVEELLQRHVNVAQAVFTGPEIVEMVMNVARGIGLAAIMVAIQQKDESITAGEMFDVAATTLDESIREKKAGLDRVLGMVEEFRRTGRRP
jgi:hypothetical protein